MPANYSFIQNYKSKKLIVKNITNNPINIGDLNVSIDPGAGIDLLKQDPITKKTYRSIESICNSRDLEIYYLRDYIEFYTEDGLITDDALALSLSDLPTAGDVAAGGGGGGEADGGAADTAAALVDGDITVTAEEADKAVRGKHTVFVPANAMFPRTDNGAGALVYVQVNSTGPNFPALLFNGTTDSYAQFTVAMPKSWDGGDIEVQFVWSHASGATAFDTVWAAKAACLSNGNAMNASFGTTVTIADTGGTADTMYISPISSPLTMSGTPDTSDMSYIVVEINRLTANAGDTLDVNARLHAISLFYTTDSASDE